MYYINASGTETFMQQYNVETNTHTFVGNDAEAATVVGAAGSRWIDGSNNRHRHDSSIGIFKGKLTAFIETPSTDRISLCQLDTAQGPSGVWQVKASGVYTNPANRWMVFQEIFDDKLQIFLTTDWVSTEASNSDNWIFSWDGESGDFTTGLDDIFFDGYRASSTFDEIHNFQPVKIGSDFYCGVAGGDGRIPENNIVKYSPKTNSLINSNADYTSLLHNNAVDNSYIAAHDLTRIPGTNKIIFATDSAASTNGWTNVMVYDVVTETLDWNIEIEAYAPNVLNNHIYGFKQNNFQLLGIANPSGDLSNNFQGVYMRFPQAASTLLTGGILKLTKDDFDASPGSGLYTYLEQTLLSDDFNYTLNTGRSKSRTNIVSDGSGLYIIQTNEDTSAPGAQVPQLYVFNPDAGDTAVRVNSTSQTPVEEAIYPSGELTFLGEVPNINTFRSPRELFMYDLDNNIDVIISSSGIARSGNTGVVTYVLFNQNSAVGNMLPMYSTDLGATWLEATDIAGGDGRSDLISAPSGISHIYHWDFINDLTGKDTESMMFRVVML